jgi:hypothetical protein
VRAQQEQGRHRQDQGKLDAHRHVEDLLAEQGGLPVTDQHRHQGEPIDQQQNAQHDAQVAEVRQGPFIAATAGAARVLLYTHGSKNGPKP